MQAADNLALRAHFYRTDYDQKAEFAEHAILGYEAAIAAQPNNAEAHFRAAMVSSAFQTRSNVPRPSALDRAIHHLVEFERLAPLDPRLGDILFTRSILRTKRGGTENLEKGVEDYEKELAMLDQSDVNTRGQVSIVLSNRAELLMMLGRLEESIASYERALEFGDVISHGYGLAVALDRDGQGFRARQVARKYALMDRANALRDGSTFYVPEGEIFYYEALRAESLENFRLADLAYKAFLQRLPASKFAARARENLAAIQPKVASQPARRRGASFPMRGWF